MIDTLSVAEKTKKGKAAGPSLVIDFWDRIEKSD
jgi:hypothetical protein